MGGRDADLSQAVRSGDDITVRSCRGLLHKICRREASPRSGSRGPYLRLGQVAPALTRARRIRRLSSSRPASRTGASLPRRADRRLGWSSRSQPGCRGLRDPEHRPREKAIGVARARARPLRRDDRGASEIVPGAADGNVERHGTSSFSCSSRLAHGLIPISYTCIGRRPMSSSLSVVAATSKSSCGSDPDIRRIVSGQAVG